ncbi:amino acid ABC transporter permease [Ensifer adhaerens]|uniref:amino acid ABC transporter permease n=1 Tax=Ensifer adhaerens TaxID=106592 RepID=UPI001CBAF481|nr:amino acid ABC transporter permease [Ensifer adhaerens]MBZ7925029.1 amino acid ABC transporter permease [Ensifer adhaerens]UAX95776.1 amino acid ABC transporter permease [Ensifer adhaerens]UAY04883.1 amino acid ABC transporter permease [Ensifer adhaerens]UAY10315.1 amino acid ABC transporter permease [Ensifer adhaerens]
MTFDFNVIFDNWALFARGTVMTILIAAAAVAVGFVVAIPIALMALSHRSPLRWLATAYVEWFRNVPFIVVLYLFFYGLPFFNVRLPEAVVGAIALAFFASSYFAEIVRGAILAVPKGQMEAARAIGMSYLQGLWEIVAPQTVRLLLPPSTNTSISMVKETSVLSTITVAELTYQGLVVQGETFAPFEVFLTTATIYWVVTAALAQVLHRTEQAFGAAQGAHQTRPSLADKYLLIGERRPA